MKRAYDPSMDSAILLGVGMAHAVSGDDETPSVAGRIYVPDLEQRHGWREKYIYSDRKPERRSIGFRKP